MKKEVVIASAARTPIGSFLGSLKDVPATELGSIVIKSAILRVRARIKPEDINQVIMGNVLSAGLGQGPARIAALRAGLPDSVKCLTVNKVCGSGLKAVMLARQAILMGDAEVVVAGGMESMSRAPYLIERLKTSHKFGHGKIDENLTGLTFIDSMVKDGLWDSFNDIHMGNLAELCAEFYGISRAEQDKFAIESYEKTLKARGEGKFILEAEPVPWGNPIVLLQDEDPKKFNKEKLVQLPPVFKKDGTVTAGNASGINDGAAAVVVMSAKAAKELNVRPMAKIVADSSVSVEPKWFTISPAKAIRILLEKVNLKLYQIDLFEINEAFSAASLAVNKLLEAQGGFDRKKVNVNGGAVALGHPIGASGARILVTLLYAMKDRQAKRGIASLCIGGGEGLAMLVER